MNDAQLFEIAEPCKQLDGKSADEPVIKPLVVVHLDKLVQINSVQVKHETQVVAPHKVVSQFDHTFYFIWIVLLQQKQ